MKTTNTLLLFLLFGLGTLGAQPTKYKYVETDNNYPESNATAPFTMVKVLDDGRCVSARQNGNERYFDVFDADLQHLYHQDFSMQGMFNMASSEAVWEDDKFHFYAFKNILSGKKGHILKTSFDARKLSVVEEELPLLGLNSLAQGGEPAVGSGRITYTFDKEEELRQSTPFYFTSWKKKKYGLSVAFVNKENQEKGKEYSILEGLKEMPEVVYSTVDEKDRIWLITQVKDSKKLMQSANKVPFITYLSKIEDEVVTTAEIGEKETYFLNSPAILTKGDRAWVIAFYSEEKIGGVQSLAYLEIDPKDMSIQELKLQTIPTNALEDLYGEGKAGKAPDELQGFQLSRRFIYRNGTSVLLAEKNTFPKKLVTERDFDGKDRTGLKKILHFGDLLVFKIDEAGELLWARGIRREASEVPLAGGAFFDNDQLHLLLNAKQDLKEKGREGMLFQNAAKGNTALWLLVLDENGEMQLDKIKDNKQNTYVHAHRGHYNAGYFIAVSGGNAPLIQLGFGSSQAVKNENLFLLKVY